MSMVQTLIGGIGIAILALGASYTVLALIAALVWQLRSATPCPRRLPAVTVLMPLCGDRQDLYARLRAFCEQTLLEYQIVFGVRELTDPALPVVERLMAEYPSLPIDVVVNPHQHGNTRKISDLLAILARAHHDVLVIADSSACVGHDYLAAVSAPLLERDVGLVTCLDRGVPTEGICSRLSAMSVNEWFVPSVLLACLFGYRSYVSSHSMCLRRSALQAISGRRASRSHLAVEHRLRKMICEMGQRVVLSSYDFKLQRHEPNLGSLTRHELHWMLRMRALRPRGFPFLIITFSVPVALVGMALSAAQPSSLTLAEALFQTTVMARLALHFVNRLRGDRPPVREFWLLPLSELLMCWAWGRTFFMLRVNSATAMTALPRAPAATVPFRRE
jgi:ceramide glucosyltransferase